MNVIFDPFNLLLLGIALVIFWRLRGVLGSRTGTERPPFDPYAGTSKAEAPAPAEAAAGKVLRFPKEREEEPATGIKEEPVPIWQGYAAADTPLAADIQRLADQDPNFTPKSFVDGAKLAYEMIVDAFARGDKAALKDLLAPEVMNSFSTAIDARAAAGQTVESRFVGIKRATITGIDVQGKRAAITMSFVSEIISATRARDGAIVEGDDREIREITDVWTFERDVSSRDPNWKLAATQAAA